MKFRITGNYTIHICGSVATVPGAFFDLILDAPSQEAALLKALDNALASYPAVDDNGQPCQNEIGWNGPPEVTELPPDQANWFLPRDIAPRLFD